MALRVAQYSFDLLAAQRTFTLQLPPDAAVLGCTMFGRNPIFWVLSEWVDQPKPRHFAYTVTGSVIELKHPDTGQPLTQDDLEHIGHLEQVNNNQYPPVIIWQLFQIRST